MGFISDNISGTTISGTTFYGDGSNLTGVSGGGTFTGGTVSGSTQFTNGLTANTISATTFYGDGSNLTGLPPSGVQSVSGLNTDNTDPLNPIIQISVDNVTITGDGTPGNPITSSGRGVLLVGKQYLHNQSRQIL